MQGIGPAFVLPNAMAILGRCFERGRKKEMVFSMFGACAPGGFVLGTVFSSLFSQLLWWPWAYWVTGIFCFFFAGAGMAILPYDPPPKFSDQTVSALSRIDAAGSTTGVIGLVLINFVWNQGPLVGWRTPYTYALLVVGVLFIIGIVESKVAFPLLAIDILTIDTGFVLACIACGWSAFGIWVFYLRQFLEELRGITPLLASAQFSPAAISGLCAAVTTGFIISRVPASFIMLGSMLAFAIGLILIATAPVGQVYWAQVFLSILIMPWGMDMSFPSATILLSDSIKHEHQGVAASLVNTVVNYSISLGLGFASTVETQVNSGGENVLGGYRGAWYMGIGLSGLGIVTSILFAISQHNAACSGNMCYTTVGEKDIT